MRELQLKDVTSQLSAVVDEVCDGEEIVITRQGRREAVVVSWEAWQKLSSVPSFIRLLASSPLEDGDIPPRERSPSRDVDL